MDAGENGTSGGGPARSRGGRSWDRRAGQARRPAQRGREVGEARHAAQAVAGAQQEAPFPAADDVRLRVRQPALARVILERGRRAQQGAGEAMLAIGRAGWVRREPDPADGRNVFVALTGEGHHLVEAVAPAHLANEEQLLAALSPAERATLAGLLRTLLRGFESPADDPAPGP